MISLHYHIMLSNLSHKGGYCFQFLPALVQEQCDMIKGVGPRFLPIPKAYFLVLLLMFECSRFLIQILLISLLSVDKSLCFVHFCSCRIHWAKWATQNFIQRNWHYVDRNWFWICKLGNKIRIFTQAFVFKPNIKDDMTN